MTTMLPVLSHYFANSSCIGYNSLMKYCIDCGKTLSQWGKNYCLSCSKKGSRNAMFGKTGANHHNFKGGYIHNTLGYKIVSLGTDKKGYEHRVIVEERLGRKLRSDEVIHHINGDKADNRIENLAILSQSRHMEIHQNQNRKPYCPHGHLFAETGAYYYKGTRKCRQCTLDRMRRKSH